MSAGVFPLPFRQLPVGRVGQFWAAPLLPSTELRWAAGWFRLTLRLPPATRVLADGRATLRLKLLLVPFGFNVNARYGGQGGI